MKCRCGFENLPDAQFCARCGAALQVEPDLRPSASSESATPAARAAASASTKPKPGLRLVIAIIVAVVAAVAYWRFSRPEPDYVLEESGLYEVSVNGKLGFIDKNGTLVIQPAYDNEYGSMHRFNEGLAPVRMQGKWGYIDSHGVMVIQPQFDAAHWFVNGVAPVQLGSDSNARWGFIGKDGKYVINPQFTNASYFQDGLAPVNVNGAMGFVNKSGAITIKPRFSNALSFSEGLAPASESGSWGYIDKSGNAAVKPQFESASPFSEEVALVRSGGKYGYIDRSGKFVINPQFDLADSFKDGFAIVEIASKRGTIEKSGKFLLNPGQVSVQNIFVRGVALAAKTDNGLGYVDKTGVWVVSPTSILEAAGEMRGGIARVRIAGEDCYINTSGIVIWGSPKGKSVYTLEKEQKERSQQALNPPSADVSPAGENPQRAVLKPATNPKGSNGWDVILPSSPEPYDYDSGIALSGGQKVSIKIQCFQQQSGGSYKVVLPSEHTQVCGILSISSRPEGDASGNLAGYTDWNTFCYKGQCTARMYVGYGKNRANYYQLSVQQPSR
jgi:hypothetical protein